MSNVQTNSWKSHDRVHGRNKRSHDNSISDNESVSSSRYQRAIIEDEKKDFINYQKGQWFSLEDVFFLGLGRIHLSADKSQFIEIFANIYD